ncbi:MAG TPA: NAD(P)/FAD-dependent oxidoreductase [Solirubrobacterales bacterium]|jgi:cation diffusion facilitator CzcD-associated flavoprotein CzcO|nr:NAD(P)/FAD-dependent oxidoreductase [Solirubrobacterales bacterium]
MPNSPEHVDVLIVGAGLSGIGAAVHLQKNSPGKSYAILESREAIGGTWDLFRYPGIRSDSDMYTLGYSFKPWRDRDSIAAGEKIRNYIQETAREHRVEDHIRFGHKVVSAEWSSADSLWTVRAERGGETVELTCGFFYGCTGYYRYDEGFTPEFPGRERFEGEVVHPQHWPEDLDYRGKRVVVIGSGATAVTLIPAMAPEAEHVTMLQRSPGYVVTLPGQDPVAKGLRRFLPDKAVYGIVRWKNVLTQMAFYQLSRRAPRFTRKVIRRMVERQLPAGYDVDRDFEPRYNPWDERVCLVPGGDLFEAVSSGKAEVVTDTIETFTEKGIKLSSGRELEADVIVTATGLNLLVLGGIEVKVDGRRQEFKDLVGYKGMMFGGVPNLALALGYTNASFTLKCDLVSQYICRLLNYMDAHGYKVATPRDPAPTAPRVPFIDLKSGYVLRSLDQLPKQGETRPWRLHQNYAADIRLLKHGPVDDEMDFSRGTPAPADPEQTTDFAAVA